MPIVVNSAISIPDREIRFQFTRSSGPGGQNVNKVSSRVDLLFDVAGSENLSEHDKHIILMKLSPRIDSGGILRISSQESRSQWKNRLAAAEKFGELLRTVLTPQKKRVKTKPTRSAREVRFKAKKTLGIKKKLRGKIRSSDE